MDPSPGQAVGQRNAELLSLQTQAWDESCGRMLSRLALLADLK